MAGTEETVRKVVAEERSSLRRIAAAPTIWAVHFVTAYALAAGFCAKAPGAVLFGHGAWRVLIVLASIAALALIARTGWQAWRQWDLLDDWDYSHGDPTSEHRHEFLGHAAFLLSVLSALGVLATTLPVLMIEGCL